MAQAYFFEGFSPGTVVAGLKPQKKGVLACPGAEAPGKYEGANSAQMVLIGELSSIFHPVAVRS